MTAKIVNITPRLQARRNAPPVGEPDFIMRGWLHAGEVEWVSLDGNYPLKLPGTSLHRRTAEMLFEALWIHARHANLPEGASPLERPAFLALVLEDGTQVKFWPLEMVVGTGLRHGAWWLRQLRRFVRTFLRIAWRASTARWRKPSEVSNG